MEENNNDWNKSQDQQQGQPAQEPAQEQSVQKSDESGDDTAFAKAEQTTVEDPANSLQFKNRLDLNLLSAAVYKIKNELRKVIVGQEEMINLLIVSILANGHSLIEGVPGVAKTVTAKLLAKTMDVDFSRIQI